MYSVKLSENTDFVDLAVVWKRGPEQSNETKGYELNYIEYDDKMDEVYKRISGFYTLKKSNIPYYESKYCIFQLK